MSTDIQKQGRSLPWFRVDNDSVDHPKVDALAEKLNEPLALAYVIRLWAWTMRYAARGRLAPGARLSVERACGWRGQPGQLWSAFVATGWIDVADDGSAEVHDWDEHQGAAVVKAEKDAERKRGARAAPKRRADGAGRSTDAGADTRADGAGNETERDGTRRDKEEEDPPPPKEPAVVAFHIDPPDLQLIDSWTKEDFWRAAELTRRKEGFPPQKWPNPVTLSRWWGEACSQASVRELAFAFNGFAADAHWRAAKPPAPFAGFMTQWNSFLPARKRDA